VFHTNFVGDSAYENIYPTYRALRPKRAEIPL